MLMDWKENESCIINKDMAFMLYDPNMKQSDFPTLIESLVMSETKHVQEAEMSEIIIQLKQDINDIESDDLFRLYDLVTDNQRMQRHFDIEYMLKSIRKDDAISERDVDDS